MQMPLRKYLMSVAYRDILSVIFNVIKLIM